MHAVISMRQERHEGHETCYMYSNGEQGLGDHLLWEIRCTIGLDICLHDDTVDRCIGPERKFDHRAILSFCISDLFTTLSVQ